MLKNRIMTAILCAAYVLPSLAFAQDATQTASLKTVSGTINTIDTVGGVINIRTDKGGDMAFSISNQARIVHNTKDVGMMSLEEGDPVTLQYDSSYPGKNIVVNLVDNRIDNT